jgi:peptidoglycan/xylan/chitin deacetylase (PgdA/CDA1 family)
MKRHLARIIQVSGTNRLFTRANARRTKILLYHAIVDRDRYDPASDPADQCIPVDAFDAQMRYLSLTCDVISLDDYLHRRGAAGKRPSVVLTFDDGFLNNATIAYPVLKHYRMKATIFIATSFVSGEETPWFLGVDRDRKQSMMKGSYREFKKQLAVPGGTVPDTALFDPMNWDQVAELSRDPDITIGSHCKRHHPLTIVPDTMLVDEIKGSKEIIEKRLGRRIDYLSYPHGIYDERAVRIAGQSGYRAALTTKSGFNGSRSDRFRLKRNNVGHGGDLDIFSCVLSGAWDFLKGGA